MRRYSTVLSFVRLKSLEDISDLDLVNTLSGGKVDLTFGRYVAKVRGVGIPLSAFYAARSISSAVVYRSKNWSREMHRCRR